MVGSVTGRRERRQWPEPCSVGQGQIDGAAAGGERRPVKARAHRRDRLAVVAMVVSQRDPAETAAPLHLRDQSFDVVGQGGARIDKPGGIA